MGYCVTFSMLCISWLLIVFTVMVGGSKIPRREFSKVRNIESLQDKFNLELNKPEKSILDPNIKITIVDTDENGKTVFRHWKPSAADIAEAEEVLIDEKAIAAIRLDKNRNITGVINSTSILYTEGAGYVFGEKVKGKTDFIDIGREITHINASKEETSSIQATADGNPIVETVIICDKEFGDVFNHNYQNILNYWVVYMWDVSMRYKSIPSSDITFQINGIVIIANTREQPFIENARADDGRAEFGRILNLYKSWVYEQRENLPPFDIAPLVTNTNLEWRGGLAHVAAACYVNDDQKIAWNTLVWDDNGVWESLTVGAHEIGYIVGAPHDDEQDFPGGCSERGFIMAGGNENLRYFFSSCSNRVISDFVKSDTASCLRTMSSNSPVLNPNYDNPKAPTFAEQCRRIMKNPQAFPEDRDPETCKAKICWIRNSDNSLSGVYFTPVDNSECANGGRCFRGFCRKPGHFFKNVGSGLCMRASNPSTSGDGYEMIECPSPGTPLDKLLVQEGKSGNMLSLPYIMGTEIGEKCGYTGNNDGDVVWSDKCDVDNSYHGWDFEDVGNNQFLLKHRVTGRCAKPQNSNIGSSVASFACNTNDNHMKWQRML